MRARVAVREDTRWASGLAPTATGGRLEPLVSRASSPFISEAPAHPAMDRRLWSSFLLALLLAVSPPAVAQEPIRGFDHFMWAVRDLDRAPAFLRDTLGFELVGTRNVMGSLANVLVWFEDDSFLEPLAPVRDDTDFGRLVGTFLDRHEGSWQLALNADPLEAVAETLGAHGREVPTPGEGGVLQMDDRDDLPLPMWRAMRIADPPGHYLFFWHLAPGWEAMKAAAPDLDPTRVVDHPNTARGIGAGWVAVWSLDETAARFARLGISLGEPVEVPRLGAVARRATFEKGDLLFLEPTATASPVRAFLATRGENLMGVSITVADLEAARRALEQGYGEPFEPYDGLDGRSLYVPADRAHGVHLEFVER